MKFVTYRGMRIDRLASAWLILRFIDSRAKFRFIGRNEAMPKGWIPFDLPDVDLSHRGEDCTFETLVKKHKIRDWAVRIIGQIVHDADIKDGKFGRIEAPGLLSAVRALGAASRNDHELLRRGLPLFDGLRLLSGRGSRRS